MFLVLLQNHKFISEQQQSISDIISVYCLGPIHCFVVQYCELPLFSYILCILLISVTTLHIRRCVC